MGHHGTKILNRHRNGHYAADIVVDVLFKRHHCGNILVGLGLGNPCYLLVVAGHSLKAGINRGMAVVYYHIAKAVGLGIAVLIVSAGHADAFQPLHAQLVGIGHLGILHHMIYRKGNYIKNGFLGFQPVLLLEIMFQAVAQGFQHRHDSLLGHILVVHTHHGNDITHLAIYKNRSGASITFVGILHPHFRAEYPERCLKLVGKADATGADFLHANPNPLDFSRSQLIKRHGIAFQHHAFIIQEKQADIVFLKEIPKACCQLS